MDKYVAVRFEDWDRMTADDANRPGFAHGVQLMDLESANRAANDLASRHQIPYYVLKVVPVSLHRATVTMEVVSL